MSVKMEFDLKEYLEARFAEQTRLYKSHAATTAAQVKSIEKRVSDLQWFICIDVAITLFAIAGISVFSSNHAHAQEVTSRICAQATN